MELFISWSGQRSHELALILKTWLPDVIQEVAPYVSSEDIAKGKRWSVEIFSRLSENSQGIICITKENQNQPWLNFEAGALSKFLEDSSVRPLLLDLSPTDMAGPLSLFQATRAESKEDMLHLVKSLNAARSKPLDSSLVEKWFSRSWPDFEKALDSISPIEEGESKRDSSDMIEEILSLVRAQRRAEDSPRVISLPAARTRNYATIAEIVDRPHDINSEKRGKLILELAKSGTLDPTLIRLIPSTVKNSEVIDYPQKVNSEQMTELTALAVKLQLGIHLTARNEEGEKVELVFPPF